MIKQLSCSVVVILMISCQGKNLNRRSAMWQTSEFAPLTKHDRSPSATNDVTSCYEGIPELGPVTTLKCFGGTNACITTTYDYETGGSYADYSCGFKEECIPAAQKAFCDNIRPPVTNCKVQCCMTDDCNVPQKDITPAMGKNLLDFVASLTKHNGSPSSTDGVTSCYSGIPELGPVTPEKCYSGANVCITYSYDMKTGGSYADYFCGSTILCTPAAKKTLCDNVFVPVTNCKVQCCTTDNCNVPEKDITPAMGKYLGFDLPLEDRQL